MNAVISQEEVKLVIKQIKGGQFSSLDKKFCLCLLHKLTTLFNSNYLIRIHLIKNLLYDEYIIV